MLTVRDRQPARAPISEESTEASHEHFDATPRTRPDSRCRRITASDSDLDAGRTRGVYDTLLNTLMNLDETLVKP